VSSAAGDNTQIAKELTANSEIGLFEAFGRIPGLKGIGLRF
jgi:hypothetical protein